MVCVGIAIAGGRDLVVVVVMAGGGGLTAELAVSGAGQKTGGQA